jgi:hypothetical protein
MTAEQAGMYSYGPVWYTKDGPQQIVPVLHRDSLNHVLPQFLVFVCFENYATAIFFGKLPLWLFGEFTCT